MVNKWHMSGLYTRTCKCSLSLCFYLLMNMMLKLVLSGTKQSVISYLCTGVPQETSTVALHTTLLVNIFPIIYRVLTVGKESSLEFTMRLWWQTKPLSATESWLMCISSAILLLVNIHHILQCLQLSLCHPSPQRCAQEVRKTLHF